MRGIWGCDSFEEGQVLRDSSGAIHACMYVTSLHGAMTAYEMLFKPSDRQFSCFLSGPLQMRDPEILLMWRGLLLRKSRIRILFDDLICRGNFYSDSDIAAAWFVADGG